MYRRGRYPCDPGQNHPRVLATLAQNHPRVLATPESACTGDPLTSSEQLLYFFESLKRSSKVLFQELAKNSPRKGAQVVSEEISCSKALFQETLQKSLLKQSSKVVFLDLLRKSVQNVSISPGGKARETLTSFRACCAQNSSPVHFFTWMGNPLISCASDAQNCSQRQMLRLAEQPVSARFVRV